MKSRLLEHKNGPIETVHIAYCGLEKPARPAAAPKMSPFRNSNDYNNFPQDVPKIA